MCRTNYLFVDFENVQPMDLERIESKPVQVALVLGEKHKMLPVAFVKQIQKFAEQVRLIETPLNGRNALDFVLAFEIGSQAQQDPDGDFHIISRDKGFDATIAHLRNKNMRAARHDALSDVPLLM